MLDLAESAQDLYDVIRASIGVAVVGEIVTFDAATSSCSVRPMVQEERILKDGTRQPLAAHTLTGVPVIFPGGASRGLRWGLAAGDHVLLIVRHRSHDEIDDGQSGPVVPASVRRSDLADVVALPGYHAPGGAVVASAAYHASGAPVLRLGGGEALRVGASTAAQALALATETKARLDALQLAHDTHMHPTAGAGAPSLPTVIVGSLGPIATTRIMTDG